MDLWDNFDQPSGWRGWSGRSKQINELSEHLEQQPELWETYGLGDDVDDHSEQWSSPFINDDINNRFICSLDITQLFGNGRLLFVGGKRRGLCRSLSNWSHRWWSTILLFIFYITYIYFSLFYYHYYLGYCCSFNSIILSKDKTETQQPPKQYKDYDYISLKLVSWLNILRYQSRRLRYGRSSGVYAGN